MAIRKLVAQGKTGRFTTSGKCSECGARFMPSKPAANPQTIHRDLMAVFKKHKCHEDFSQAAARIVRDATENH